MGKKRYNHFTPPTAAELQERRQRNQEEWERTQKAYDEQFGHYTRVHWFCFFVGARLGIWELTFRDWLKRRKRKA